MNKYSLFFCEGMWDSYFLFRILKEEFKFQDEINEAIKQSAEYKTLIQWIDSRKAFYCVKSDHLLALVQCGNKENTLKKADTLYNKQIKPDRFPLYSIGIFIDMNDSKPEEINNKIRQHLSFSVMPMIGTVQAQPITHGIWAFPDCKSSGAVERVLLTCYRQGYPDLLEAGDQYLRQVPMQYTNGWNERRKEKALLSSAAAVLQETGMVSHSIAYDHWYSAKENSVLPEFVQFLKDLL